jgi:flagellar hook protein FlgE
MSLLRSLNTASAGLRSHTEAIGVTGDNIANVNTVGFKRQRAHFQDLLGRSIASNDELPQAGAGSRLSAIENMWAQGALLTTDSPTDLAISGDGLFVVSGNVAGIDGNWYTRAGQFKVDADGRLVNLEGLRVQGYTAAADGTLGTTVGDLTVDGFTIPANPTENALVAANLDANATVPAAFDITDPSNTSNFSSQVTVYDSLGNPRQLTVFYRKTADNAWEWFAAADGADLAGGTPGALTQVGTGTLAFDTNGALNAETGGALTLDFADGAAAGQAIALDFGESVTEGGDGLEGTTQFASPSTTTALQQDGFGSGAIAGVAVEADGAIVGVFSNGQRRLVGQLAVAKFASNDGLDRAGQGLWAETEASGQPLLGAATTGGRGAVVSGTLEQSNVDLGNEFVNLIAYQRGFQANSRIVTTTDEMYVELVNLKR